MPELIAPTARLHAEWLDAHDEWGPGAHEDGFGLRHELDERTWRLGHVGYGVRPTGRGRGLATWALGRVLDEARALALHRMLLVCKEDNLASVRTTERHGGVLDGVQDTEHGVVRRYWITL